MKHTESNYLKAALSHLEEMSTAGIAGQAVGNQYVAIAQIKLAQREYHSNQEQRDALLAALKDLLEVDLLADKHHIAGRQAIALAEMK